MTRLLDSLRRRTGGRDAASLVDRALRRAARDDTWWSQSALRSLPELQAIVSAPDDVRLECVELLARAGSTSADAYSARGLLAVAARKRLPLTTDDAASLLELVLDTQRTTDTAYGRGWWAMHVLGPLAPQIERVYKGASEHDRARLAPLIEAAATETEDAALSKRLLRLLHGGSGTIPLQLVADGDDVGPRLRAIFSESVEDTVVLAELLTVLASYPRSGRPSKKWLTTVDGLRRRLGDGSGLATALLDALLVAGDATSTSRWNDEELEYVRFIVDINEPLACGVAMFAGLAADDSLVPRLRRLALKSVTVIGGQFGQPRSLRLANACAHAIAISGTRGAITELLALERGVTHGALLREIRKAVDALASAQGVTRGELLEQAVERHELEPDGTRTVRLSEGDALVEVDATSVRLVHVNADGARRSAFPPAAQATDEATLASLRDDVKRIRKTIAGERNRLDGLLAEARAWPLEDWKRIYLDHPITGRLARASIWAVRGKDGTERVGLPLDGRTLTASDGAALAIPRGAEVRLWHPIEASPGEVATWRSHVLDHELRQPFKQAYRELYVVTPAEEDTAFYSNRFAGHVFGQVQARALMKRRGWSPVAVGWWDDGIDHGVARRVFDSHGVRAEFFFDPITDVEPQGSDVYPYCTSDQVRFFDAASDDVVPVRDVPRVVFSEAMRDVDLFIAVTSIGADPQWLDRGEGRQFERYWHRFAFGKLAAAAEIRREVLEQLVSRLAIADRLRLEDRYLVVTGELRTYRIHLGSGNILMSPNHEYLCIVAARDGRVRKVFLPFDDDPVLSLILSKAFMLANDTAITDPAILRQIRR